ncbi:MAG: hypothetical protein QOH00_3861, partial [Gaiellales bacterium]|nr:hypothetical protein [Gaiellales bacterium]
MPLRLAAPLAAVALALACPVPASAALHLS